MGTGGQTAAGVTVPDTKLAREATDVVVALGRVELQREPAQPETAHQVMNWSVP